MQAFLQFDQPADPAVSVLEGMDMLKVGMEGGSLLSEYKVVCPVFECIQIWAVRIGVCYDNKQDNKQDEVTK